MKTLKYITNDETKEASIKNSSITALIPFNTIHINGQSKTYQSINSCKTCSNKMSNDLKGKSFTNTSTTNALDFSLLNENIFANSNNDKSKNFFKTNLIKPEMKLNIYSSLSFTNSDDFFRINSTNESILKSKSVNNYLNDVDSTNVNNVSNTTSNINNCKFEEETDNAEKSVVKTNTNTSWNVLCKLINCKVAFKKQYNGKKYNWIQLAGHAGRFIPGDREGFILKIMEDLERKCLESLQKDVLAPFVPSIDKIVRNEEDGKDYTEMQDLLYSFHHPSIMDIKIGVRTFVVDDSDEKECKPRNDLYLKLIEMAPEEPSEKEHELKAITKRRYMSWRERSTCSAQYGFRIEAIKKNHVSEKEFYTVKEKTEAKNHFKNFADNKKNIMVIYLNRLIDLKNTLLNSEFFYSHELIGSSLLFVHDNGNAGVWMIDFGKTRPLPEGIQISHDKQWKDGTREDGYLIGIESLINIFQECINELN